jgi:hypothetical protein
VGPPHVGGEFDGNPGRGHRRIDSLPIETLSAERCENCAQRLVRRRYNDVARTTENRSRPQHHASAIQPSLQDTGLPEEAKVGVVMGLITYLDGIAAFIERVGQDNNDRIR